MNLKQRYQKVLTNIIDTKKRFSRVNDNVQLLAVSKKHSAQSIRTIYELGQHAFGENYVQEALDKQQELKDCQIDWHFIGPIQSNKTKQIAEHFNWVHSISREKIALRLNEARVGKTSKLNVLIQVNINQESTKEGIPISKLESFCQFITKLPNLNLRGFMAIPEASTDFDTQKNNFAVLHQQFLKHKEQYQLDTLSIGMSNDYQAAISEGSTLIRIGTDIFGERN